MEVILSQDVDRIGKAGSVVKVKDGFARNFLLPNGLAVPLNAANLKNIEADKQRKLEAAQKNQESANKLKEKLDNLSLTIAVLTQGENKLYGSIGINEIVHALKDEGFEIEKSMILLKDPIKTLGIFEVNVRLHPEVLAKIKIWIVKK